MDLDQQPATDVRCTACGARNAAGSPWCSLCYASLQAPAPDPEPAPEPDPEPTAVVAGEDGEDGEAAENVPDVEGPAARRVDALLAELAVQERRPARFGALNGLVSSPAARVGLMLGGTLLFAAAGFGLMAALGSLL